MVCRRRSQRFPRGSTDHTVGENAVAAAVARDDSPAGALPFRSRCRGRAPGVPGLTLRQGLHLLLVDVEVRVDVLDIVVLFESIVQPQHPLAFLPSSFTGFFGTMAISADSVVMPAFCERFQDRFVRFRRRENFPSAAMVAKVVGAGVEHDVHELVLGRLVRRR